MVESEFCHAEGKMMRRLGLLSILSILVADPVEAQDKPDFSGHWVLATSAGSGPDVAQSLTVRQPIVRTDVFGAPIEPYFKELTVEREVGSRVRTDTYQIGLEGGTVGAVASAGGGINPNANRSQTRFSVRWEGDRLVIETASNSGPTSQAGPYTEHTEVWQLNASGMLILSITDRGSGIGSTSITLAYRKN
jgi:hypothetical protein